MTPTAFINAMKKTGLTGPEIDDLWKAISASGASFRFGNDLSEETAKIKERIEEINKHIFHQRDIIDEIKESEKEVNNYLKKREELQKSIEESKKKGEDVSEKEAELNQNEYKLAQATLKLREEEQRKRIEGYNKIDRFEKDFENRTHQLKKGVDEVKSGIKQIGDSVNKILGPWTKMSQAAANYAKNIGLSGKAMDKLRKSTIDIVANRGIGIKYNTSVEELMQLQQGYTKNVGRQVQLGNNDLETLAATSRILGPESTQQFMAKFENFGLSMEEAGKRAGKMFATASKSGIAWENYSKNFLDNITLAQRYTFKNGTRGLESMAKKATEINLNMSQAASFAERVNTVEGAVKTGAQLQVLGGPFAQMADPIGMLYESLNDMEGLQDRMIKMFGNLGSFNKQTGEVEISAFNRVRIKEAAKAMGIDENNLFETINSNARRNEIANQIRGNANIDKETAELIKNVGVIKNGKAGVNINGQFVEAQNVTNSDAKYLQEIARSESDDVKDIAQRLRGWDDSVQGFAKQKDAVHGQLVESMGIGKGVQNLINNVGEMKLLLQGIAGSMMIGGAFGAIGGAFGTVKGMSHIGGGVGNLMHFGGGNISARQGTMFFANTRTGSSYATNHMGQWVNQETGQIMGRQGRRVLDTRIGMSAGAKSMKGAAARGATMRIGGAMMKGANIAGWAGLVGELGTDYMINSGKWKRGGVGDYAGHIGSRAAGGFATGAMIGSLIPILGQTGIGQIVGGSIGAIGGALSGYNTARKNDLYNQIGDYGVSLFGSYKRSELKQIRNAAKGQGHISEDLKEKMLRNGDQEAIAKLDEISKSVVHDGAVNVRPVDAQKKAAGGIVEGTSTSGDKNVVMSNAGEMVLNQGQQANLFNAIKSGDFTKIAPSKVEPRQDGTTIVPPKPAAEKPMKLELSGTWNINIGGTINAITPDGTSKKVDIDINALSKVIEQNLAKKISEELSRMERGGRLVPEKGYFYQGG